LASYTVPARIAQLRLPVPVQPRSGTDIVLGGSDILVISSNTTVGNITLSGDSVLVVQNSSAPVTVTIDGNVRLEQHSTFYVNRSNLVANESFDNQLSVTLENESFFLVVGANTSARGHQWTGEVIGNANLSVIGSHYCYPSSWFPVTVAGNASVYLYGSYFSSDLVLQDAPYLPSTAHVVVHFVIGFNLWVGFTAGSRANLTLPAPDTFQSWEFPGAFNVSGINYSVDIITSIVGLHVMTLWPGSNVSVRDSPGIVVALDPLQENVTFTGLREGWLNSTLAEGGFALRLSDTNVESWNIYPFAAGVTVASSQVGELLPSLASTVDVWHSNLTGHGGYYGAFDTSSLSIFDSTVAAPIVGYGSSRILLANCSVARPLAGQVLAAEDSTIVSRDSTLEGNMSYAALDLGQVDVQWTVSVRVTENGAATGDARVAAAWSNDTVAASATSPSNGSVQLTPVAQLFRASGETWMDLFRLWAAWEWSAALDPQLNLSAPVSVALALQPLVLFVDPANGTEGLANAVNLTIEFGFPMNISQTSAALSLLPSASILPQWAPNASQVTVAVSGLAWGTSYDLEIGPGAATASGVPWPGSYVSDFSTAPAPIPPPPPAVVEELPANGSIGLSIWTNVTILFTDPMDPTNTSAAFVLTPTVLQSSVTVSGSGLNWTHTIPLDAGVTYSLELGIGASNRLGGHLARPVLLTFTVAPAPVTPTPIPKSSNTTAFPLGETLAIVGAIALAAVVAGFLLLRRPVAPAPAPPSAPAAPADPTVPPSRPDWEETPPEPPPSAPPG
jgi:hypothetical protein